MNTIETMIQRIEERLMPLVDLTIDMNRVPQAAVSLILRLNTDQLELLVIKRAERIGDPWSGHLALPGGRASLSDPNLLATAARETWEEIGIDLAREGRFLGRLPLLDTKNPRLPELEITPFVAVAPPVFDIRPNHEVAATFWCPIGPLKREGASIEYKFRYGDVILTRPAYPSEGGPIWGITERILTSFLSYVD